MRGLCGEPGLVLAIACCCAMPLWATCSPEAPSKGPRWSRYFCPIRPGMRFSWRCAARNPRVVVGESSFLRVALEDAKKLGIWEAIPEGVHLLCAGTPLDMELLPLAEECDIGVHDLYGCQEFGWLVMDGAPLRDDLTLVPDAEREGWAILVAGGLPTGDSFPMGGAGHVLNADGPIHTYARQRTTPELEVVVRACTAQSEMTLERACRSILRIKGAHRAPSARCAHCSRDQRAGSCGGVAERAVGGCRRRSGEDEAIRLPCWRLKSSTKPLRRATRSG